MTDDGLIWLGILFLMGSCTIGVNIKEAKTDFQYCYDQYGVGKKACFKELNNFNNKIM